MRLKATSLSSALKYCRVLSISKKSLYLYKQPSFSIAAIKVFKTSVFIFIHGKM